MYYKERTWVIIETDESQDLQGELTSWIPKRINGIFSVQRRRLKTQKGVSVQVQRQEKVMTQFKGMKAGGILSDVGKSQPFCSNQTFNWFDGAHLYYEEQSALLSLLN